jgi:hypothetical protein
MKVMAVIFTVLAVLVGMCAIPVNAQIPPLPHAFYGTVKINGVDAPAYTTTVKATDREDGTTDKVITGIGNPITTTEPGRYGSESPLGTKLVVQGSPDTPIPEGTPIYFFVNGGKAETEPVLVEWHSGEITEVNLTVTITVPLIVSTSAATAIGTTTATLNGNLTNLGSAVSVQVSFEWGLTATYDNPTSPQPMTSTGSFSAPLSGLSPGTTYHFRAKAVGEGTSYGIDRTFATTASDVGDTTPPRISDISVSPSEVNIGETVTISVLVTNTGSASGSYKVTLKINGAVEATKGVTLNAGASEEVTFTTAKDVAGSYLVAVNGLSGSFTVKEKLALPPTAPPTEAPPEVKPPLNWPIIGGIIAGVVIVGLLIFFLIRRRAY